VAATGVPSSLPPIPAKVGSHSGHWSGRVGNRAAGVESLGDAARSAFVAALDTLAKSGLVWVVATMRSDFFDRLRRCRG